MSAPTRTDLSAFSLLDLFRSEAAAQTGILAEGLLALERDTADLGRIDALMRAAHSIKGAAAIVDLPRIVALAHRMEDVFIAVQQGRTRLTPAAVDALLAGVDLVAQVAQVADVAEANAPQWFIAREAALDEAAAAIGALAGAGAGAPDEAAPAAGEPPRRTDAGAEMLRRPAAATPLDTAPADPSLKVSVAHLNELLSLASQSVASAHKLAPLVRSLQRVRKQQADLFSRLDDLQQAMLAGTPESVLKGRIAAMVQAAGPVRQDMVQRMAELETHERTLLATAQTTLDEVLALRMRPFKEGVHALPRMVRDLARELGKEVRLEITGENTPVDRELLARMESPLNHLVRNAIDHGIEPPARRAAMGKPPEGVLRIAAYHAGGMLHVDIGDDGQGVDPERIRRRLVDRHMATETMAAALSKAELLAFLFLPAFSLKDDTSLVSGRGVGLDVVHETIRQQYGTVEMETTFGHGMKTMIVLPLTQSVVRALVTDVGAQAYAIPIAKIGRVLRVPAGAVHTLEDKPFLTLDGEHVGLIDAAQLLGVPAVACDPASLNIVVIGSGNRRYGLVVDALAGEQSLAAQPLDAIFGKMRDIAAGALLENGLPVLILDVPDLLLSIEKLLGTGGLQPLRRGDGGAPMRRVSKRILVVDDSLTVREMERNLLLARGYAVDVAVDGVDGWNAVRSNDYDLLITDVDMPRMDGIELVGLVRKDPRLLALPVMIVSYKDRPEDRARGIHAGADYYVTKGSFHDETLLDAVIDLIGAAVA